MINLVVLCNVFTSFFLISMFGLWLWNTENKNIKSCRMVGLIAAAIVNLWYSLTFNFAFSIDLYYMRNDISIGGSNGSMGFVYFYYWIFSFLYAFVVYWLGWGIAKIIPHGTNEKNKEK